MLAYLSRSVNDITNLRSEKKNLLCGFFLRWNSFQSIKIHISVKDADIDDNKFIIKDRIQKI